MKRVHPLTITAVALVLLLLLALLWLATQGQGGLPRSGRAGATAGTNPALDVRYTYDSSVLTPAPYNERAEFPLRLNADNWSFYGKRISGVGALLDHTGAMLYDFVGSQAAEAFESHYQLKPVGKPLYEDTQLHGALALHQQMTYAKRAGEAWPEFFPAKMNGPQAGGTPDAAAELTAATQAYIDGWAFFTKNDLYFFYAISPQPFESGRTSLCQQLIESMEFNAVLGGEGRSGNVVPVPADQVPRPDSEPSEPQPLPAPAPPGR